MRKIKITNHEVTRKHRRIGNVLLAWMLVIFLMFLVIFVGIRVVIAVGKSNLFHNATSQMPQLSDASESADGQAQNPDGSSSGGGNEIFKGGSAESESNTTTWKEGWVRHDGKVYEYNEDILTFLFLGIDKMEKVAPNKDLVSGGQSDAIFLLVANPDTKELSLVGVNRDTMVDVVMVGIGENGGDLIYPAEIATQHGFGDGLEGSCELTRDAVSKLFYELPIHGYVSFNMGGVAALNDALGGVEVTIQSDLTKINKEWVQGATVTLMGKDAYKYIHDRDTKVFESARDRLGRQKQYLSCFVGKAMSQVKKDITLPVTLYQKFKPYIVTDLSVDEIAYLATELSGYSFRSEAIYTLEGETKMGEKFEEFYPDKEALKSLMIQLFYREVEVETAD